MKKSEKIKVVYIYRQHLAERYSIEELFNTISSAMMEHAAVEVYKVGPLRQLLKDVYCLWRLRADIYHVTGDINYMACLLPWHKTMVTIHDLGNYIHNLKSLKRCLYKWLWLLLPMRLARMVTTISAQTKADMLTHLKVKPATIRVVLNCCSPLLQPAAGEFNALCPQILQIGTAENKNIMRLIEAIRYIPCQVLFVGRLTAAMCQKLQRYHINYKQYIDLSSAQIYALYLNCDIVTFISLHEGFGMPIIEANAVGRALITANYAPMADLAGSGACLVDPLNILAIRHGLLRVIAQPNYRAELVAQGFDNVKRFSVVATVAAYYELYREILAY